MTTRLDKIASRQRVARVRDLVFATFVALAATIALAGVETAAASAHVAQQR